MSLLNSLHRLIGNAVTDWGAAGLGNPAQYNAQHASQVPQKWVSPTPLPGEVPLGRPDSRTGIQETYNPAILRSPALPHFQPHPFFPYDGTGMHGNRFNAPMQPTYQPIVNQMPLSFTNPSPDIQGVQNSGFTPAQGSKGFINFSNTNQNTRIFP